MQIFESQALYVTSEMMTLIFVEASFRFGKLFELIRLDEILLLFQQRKKFVIIVDRVAIDLSEFQSTLGFDRLCEITK